MNHRCILTIILSLSLLLGGYWTSAQTAEELLPKAIQLEEVKGELEKAIEIYQTIVDEHSDNRQVAAKAQLHIGMCYEKLGKQAAQKAYKKVIQEFSDQQKIVGEARIRLSRLNRMAGEVQAEDIVIRKVIDGTGAGFVIGNPSPNGKYFAFVDWSTNPTDIVIKEIGTKKEIHLKNQTDLNYEGDTGDPYFPTWSPDSKKIAYTWENDKDSFYELRVIEIDNPEPDVLIRVSYSEEWLRAEDWSPDGQHILVQITKNNQDQIGLISTMDGSFNLLKKFDDSNPTSARFSPDGHYIAYDLSP
ncbi:MAG: tetratricopeptide repeat protein, partial [Deltaproteobacteria bacterium]|nr:tetratricopeptide repeat protein [Deltaproteobacteria bacterium]